MPNPKLLRLNIDVESGLLQVVVSRDVTDDMTGATTRRDDTITGPLSDLTGLGALRNNLVAWVKAQSGFAGTVDLP